MSGTRGKNKRPLWLKVLAIGYLVLAFFGTMRLAAVLQYGNWLERFSLPFPPAYLAAGGALWALTGTAAAVWVWFRLPARAYVAGGAAALLTLTYWVDRLVFTRSQTGQANLPFAIGLTVLLLVFAAGAVMLMAQEDGKMEEPDGSQ